jgi:predicted dehydrogenase
MGFKKPGLNVLVVGCGSIGRRHIKNLLGLQRVAGVFVYSRRKKGLKDMAGGKRVHAVDSLDAASVDCAFICNETFQHVETALLLAKRGIPLFIEKPLSHSLVEAKKLCQVVRRRRLPVYVAYNLRFLGAVNYLRKLVQRGALGKLWSARIEAGQYLPDWRPGRDWRNTYSAIRMRGGGVALDLSHEVDYMRWLFGEPQTWCGESTQAGDLRLDVDCLFEAIYRFKEGFLCSVHLDFLQKNPRRAIRIMGTKGTVECDLIGRRITVNLNGCITVLKKPILFDMNKTYTDEAIHFIHCLDRRKSFRTSMEDGIRAMELIHV